MGCSQSTPAASNSRQFSAAEAEISTSSGIYKTVLPPLFGRGKDDALLDILVPSPSTRSYEDTLLSYVSLTPPFTFSSLTSLNLPPPFPFNGPTWVRAFHRRPVRVSMSMEQFYGLFCPWSARAGLRMLSVRNQNIFNNLPTKKKAGGQTFAKFRQRSSIQIISRNFPKIDIKKNFPGINILEEKPEFRAGVVLFFRKLISWPA